LRRELRERGPKGRFVSGNLSLGKGAKTFACANPPPAATLCLRAPPAPEPAGASLGRGRYRMRSGCRTTT